MKLGEKVRELLDERNMSQKELAKELHMAASTLNGYITGKRQPDYGTLIDIAEFFHVSTDYLLGVSSQAVHLDSPLSVREENLVGLYRNLQPDKQDMLYDQAQFYHQQELKQNSNKKRTSTYGNQAL